ncbi:MAG: elongation factor G, partial [Deinococcus sp.]|nr:elongation factor G [Deinococcus sp.]
VVGGVIPSKFIPSVEKGVIAARQEGVLAGYRVVGIKVTVYDGSYHDVDSSDIAFQLAGRLGFRNAFEKARPTILEPIMRLKVTVPDSYTGDIIGDITSRRGRVLEMQPDGRLNTILATVPQAEILEYSPTLRSITGGRGVYSVKFERYEEAPPEIVQRVVAQAQARREAG